MTQSADPMVRTNRSTLVVGSDRPTSRISAGTLARRLGPVPAGVAGPAYRVLAHRIRSAVLDGRLAVAAGLPSERELAVGMAISRTTVAAAYALLREQGWIDSRRGSGSRLTLPGAATGSRQPAPGGPAGIFGYPPMLGDDFIDLSRACLPAPEPALTAAVRAAVADLPAYTGGDGYYPFGLPVLREAIAARYTLAGAPTRPEHILVTSGAQHALHLCLQELSAPGEKVMIECPTYPVALDAIRAARRIPGTVGLVDGENGTGSGAWDVELMQATLRQTGTRLAYVIPDFQNPTGALMDTSTRERLVAASASTGTTLLVDESFREVPFPGIDMPVSMAAAGNPDQVICLGSVSKAFWGGLRIGWVRAATPVINRLAVVRALGDMSGPVLEQLIAAHLLDDPDEALAAQRHRLALGAAALVDTLVSILPDWRPTHPKGGACLWVRLPGPFAAELARLAPSIGVRIAPGPRFGPDGTMESYLRLPFTAPVERLQAGVRRLATIAERAAAALPAGLPGWIA